MDRPKPVSREPMSQVSGLRSTGGIYRLDDELRAVHWNAKTGRVRDAGVISEGQPGCASISLEDFL
jgi:hypothetical protein